MSNFVKLLNFEWNRFIKLYSILFALVFIFQVIGLLILISVYTSSIQHEVTRNNMSPDMFVQSHGLFGLDYLGYSLWFLAPIAISIAALLFYVPFIWYRDWFMRNTFIYRLFMLPTSRMNIFFAKLTTIMISVLSMVAFQLLLLSLYKEIIKWMIPVTYRSNVGVIDSVMNSSYLSIIVPGGVMDFFVAYGLGLATIVVAFTVILMERSFKWKGIVMGVFYVSMMMIIFLAPILVMELLPGTLPLYPGELFFVELGMWLIITVGSIWLSSYLLKYKVTV